MQGTFAGVLVQFGTIAAALIAGFFSFLNLVIAKEQKVSEFRQAWIDELRADISKFVAAITYIASANELWGRQGRPNPIEHHRAIESSFGATSLTFTSIFLRINPADPNKKVNEKNQEFLSTLKNVRDAAKRDDWGEAKRLAQTLSERAQPILKHEWERVKKGEPIYRLTKYLAAVIVVTSAIAGTYFCYRAYHEPQAVVPAISNPANTPVH